jgi:hypothetical protein
MDDPVPNDGALADSLLDWTSDPALRCVFRRAIRQCFTGFSKPWLTAVIHPGVTRAGGYRRESALSRQAAGARAARPGYRQENRRSGQRKRICPAFSMPAMRLRNVTYNVTPILTRTPFDFR